MSMSNRPRDVVRDACAHVRTPGTGKTTTSVQILRGWAALKLRPAVCVAECNVAVDNIAMGLAAAGVAVVRVGRADKLSADLEAISLDALVRRRWAEGEARAAVHACEVAAEGVAAVEAAVEELRGRLDAVDEAELQRQLAAMRAAAGEPKEEGHPAGGLDAPRALGAEPKAEGVAPPPLPAAASANAADAADAAEELVLAGCRVDRLNGRYIAHPPSVRSNGRRVYQRVVEDAAASQEEGGSGGVSGGGGAAPCCCFHYAGSKGAPAGWYLARMVVPSGAPFSMAQPPGKKARKAAAAFCASDAERPPPTGWVVTISGARQADPSARFDVLPSASAALDAPQPDDPPSRRCDLLGEICRRERARLGGAAADEALRAARAAAEAAAAAAAPSSSSTAAAAAWIDPETLRELQAEVLLSADVVCSQMLSAGGDFLKRLGPVQGLLIDEVSCIWAWAWAWA